MTSIRRILIGSALALLSFGLMTTPASASAPPDTYYDPPTPFSDSYSFTFDECEGITFDVTGHESGIFWNLNVPGSNGQAFLNTNHLVFSERWTNPKTRKWFVVKGDRLFQEVKATRVPIHQVPPDLVPPEGLVGPIYRFESVEYDNPGLLFQTRSGRTVLRDQGTQYATHLFDTLGDHQPGGNTLSYDSKAVGHFPSFHRDLCAIAKRLTT